MKHPDRLCDICFDKRYLVRLCLEKYLEQENYLEIHQNEALDQNRRDFTTN